MTRRIINLGGGTYNANIQGDYIQGEKKEPEPKMKSAAPSEESDNTINTNGANYTESPLVLYSEK